MCQGCNKVMGHTHTMQRHEHPSIVLMNQKRTLTGTFCVYIHVYMLSK